MSELRPVAEWTILAVGRSRGWGIVKRRIIKVIVGLCAVGLCATGPVLAAGAKPPAHSAAEMDKDLMEVTIPQLQGYYAQHKYTVTQVVDWYLARIARY